MDYIIREVEEKDVSNVLKAGLNIVDQYERTHLGDEVADGYINSGACESDYLAQVEDMLLLEKEDNLIGIIIWKENGNQRFIY